MEKRGLIRHAPHGSASGDLNHQARPPINRSERRGHDLPGWVRRTKLDRRIRGVRARLSISRERGGHSPYSPGRFRLRARSDPRDGSSRPGSLLERSLERRTRLLVRARSGPYWETYPNGRTRTKANYVDSRLKGPVAIRHEDGGLFLRGFLEAGEWSGPLEIFHDGGRIWFAAHFESGRLEGTLRTHFPDGALESETRYQAGREDGLARSFYPTAAGGRLKSEAHVEADQLVGEHRILDRKGDLIRLIDWNAGPAAWRVARPIPASADLTGPARATSDPKRDLHD